MARPLLFGREPLFQKVVKELQRQMAQGELSDPLPGEVALARELGVSRPVLRQALEALAKEGWLEIGQGRRTRLGQKALASTFASALAPAAGVRTGGRLLVVSPLSVKSPLLVGNEMKQSLRGVLEAKGWHWQALFDPRLRSTKAHAAVNLLEELYQANRPDCLLFMSSTEAMQRWAVERGRPVVVLGSTHPGISLSSVDTDYRALGWHAGGRFAAAGCAEVKVLVRLPLRAGDEVTIAGLRSFVEAEQGGRVAVHPLVGGREEVEAQVGRLFRQRSGKARVGWMIFQPADAVTVLSALLVQGRRIPEEIALLSKESAPLMEALVPDLSRYESAQERIVKQATKLVERVGGVYGGPVPTVRVIPRFLPGKTL